MTDARSETLTPLGHDFYDDTSYDDLEEVSDPSSPLMVTPSLEFSTVNDHHE